MLPLALMAVVRLGSPAGAACSTSLNCSLNGDCVHGECVCDPAWSAAADCSALSFQAVDKAAGAAPGYYNGTEASWGGNVVKGDDGKYHLIHAQFANHCGIYSSPQDGGWTNNSFVARSESTTGKPEGPYRFVEEIVPPFAHNPEIHRDVSGTFVVFFIGGWNTTVGTCNVTASAGDDKHEADAELLRDQQRHPPHPPPCTAPNWKKTCGAAMPGPNGDLCGPCRAGLNCGCGISVATAKSLSGPWTVESLRITDQWLSDEVYCTHTNPTVQILPNGTYVMAFNAGMCQGKEMIGTAVSHGGWRGPWQLLGRNAVLRNAADDTPYTSEDPMLWVSHRGWHLMTHSYGKPRVSSYAYSEDGLAWTVSPSAPYNWTIHYTDGTSANLSKCERPKLFFSEPAAASGGTEGTGQAVPHRQPLFLINGARSLNPAPGGGRRTWTMIRPLTTAKATPMPPIDTGKPLAPSPFLPPLLRKNSGAVVASPSEWPARKQEVAELLQKYLLGTVPLERPALIASTTLNTTRLPRGALSSYLRLTFDTGGGSQQQNISFDVELLHPALKEGAKHPLFLTMYTHRPWALMGLARGYAAVVVPNCDGQDIAPAFQRAYAPRYSMALIMARAFVASLTLDYALTLPYINTEEVCMTGHSRNGKLSLVAAAFDDRITAVVGSSPGAPIATPFRFSSAMYFGQDAVTSPPPSVWFSWFTPKCREFIGRENEMPIDGHGVLGMIAPRAAAIATAWQDRESDLSFGNEMNLKESATVYELLGAERNLTLLYRPGDHHGYIDPGSYFDYFDQVFKRYQGLSGNHAAGVSPASDAFISPAGFDWNAWQRLTNATKDDAPSPEAKSTTPLTTRISWLLDTPVASPAESGSGRGGYSVPDAYCEEANPGQYVTLLMDHDRSKSDRRYVNLTAVPFSFGQYRTATAYYSKEAIEERWRAGGGKRSASGGGGPVAAPAAIWLHPYSYNRGFDTGGNNTDTFLVLAKAGYVVFAFDLAGMGMRANQGGQRYYRQVGGHGSLLGLHITDTLALLQAVLCFSPEGHSDPRCSQANRGFTWETAALDALPSIDSKQVIAGGFSLGGNIALHAAAIDRRIAAVFSIAGFTPLRTDTADRGTGGLKRLSHLHALAPKLGLFVGSERAVPYDYDDLLRAIAPRPTLLVTPTRDRDATLADVVACINSSRPAWKKKQQQEEQEQETEEGEGEGLLVHLTPNDYSRLSMNITDATVRWASSLFKAP